MFRATAPASSRASGSRTSELGPGPQVVRHPSSSKYPWRLSFYHEQPVDDVTLEEFEEFAIARLRMLALIESSQIRGTPHVQLLEMFKKASTKYLPLAANTSRGDLERERKKDVVSHFVLRLAFCGSEELRRRFLRAETTLFRLRFETDDREEKQSFLKALQLDWKIVSREEKDALQAELLATSPHLAGADWPNETFFKVPWTLVPDLVGRRKVYLKAGLAYVPQKEQMSLVLQAFQERLERGLETTAKHLPRLDEDARLLPILNHLSLSYLNGSTSSEYMPDDEDGERVTSEQVDHLAPRHFPPCMRHLWETGREQKHLKHFARLQLGLFLKGVGLSVEEALLWWRKLFNVGGKMSDDKFKKEYEYNIKHSYGLVGGKKNYPPKNCQSILTANQPGSGDTHGCPFRHFSPDRLGTYLQNTYKLNGLEMQEILAQVKSTHFHVACTRVFEITHAGAGGVKKGEGVGGGESVDHPNKWFDRSWELEKLANGDAPSNGVKKEVKAEDQDTPMDLAP